MSYKVLLKASLEGRQLQLSSNNLQMAGFVKTLRTI